MKAVLYVIGGFVAVVAILGALFGIAALTGIQGDNPFIMVTLIGLCGIAPVGAFWMMYQTIRYEKSPFPLIGLAVFIPFTFVWYYFERYRPDRERRTPERFGSDIAE